MYKIGYQFTSFAFDKFEGKKPIPIRIRGYVITLNGESYGDKSIANRIKMNLSKYQDILIKNGAHMAEDNCCLFDDEDKANAAAMTLKFILGG